ncbi:hypothetical protein DPMN_143277 [Dreissena polymorpha]|uniref:Uncharacterized protein n=1 Tax=Dreissena polymorpha TaxID=45954 RepID=A0A9D4GDB2_DREPO|nr:hypothetical protein DPMN_143277 [Dreissena polymorpha]
MLIGAQEDVLTVDRGQARYHRVPLTTKALTDLLATVSVLVTSCGGFAINGRSAKGSTMASTSSCIQNIHEHRDSIATTVYVE